MKQGASPAVAAAGETLESYLLKHGQITEPVFQRMRQVASAQGESFKASDWLLSEQLIDEEELAKAKAEYFGVAYADLRRASVPDEAAALVPKESWDFYNIAPFALENGVLKVAIDDPTNLQALQALEFVGQKHNVQIQLRLTSRSSIDRLIGRTKTMTNVVGQALQEFQRTTQEQEKRAAVKPKAADNIEGAPIIRIVDVILNNAIEANASDIHIEPSDNDVRVRYRIDGILHTALVLPKHAHAAVVSRIKILSNLKIEESRLPQDGRFHVEMAGKSVDLRVSLLPLIYGEKVVMRILDKTGKVPTLDALGVRGKALEWVMENIKKAHGIFLITGPTGSGKSTTLYSILSLINTLSVNIVTLEDPVEYFIEGVNQSQVNPDIGLTFASGLRSILRQDPNVIMVGEIRDKETAELAVHSALTGHLVFSTLHTNNAIGAMPRLIDMQIEPFLLTASVNVVAAQRLVRSVCPSCRRSDSIAPALLAQLRQELLDVPPVYFEGLNREKMEFYKGQGCEQCERTGYKGRLGIFEVLPMLPEVQDLVLAKVPSSKVFEFAKTVGMISMRQDGIIKALRGETTLEEVIRVTQA